MRSSCRALFRKALAGRIYQFASGASSDECQNRRGEEKGHFIMARFPAAHQARPGASADGVKTGGDVDTPAIRSSTAPTPIAARNAFR
jgi:hypothetical protein